MLEQAIQFPLLPHKDVRSKNPNLNEKYKYFFAM